MFIKHCITYKLLYNDKKQWLVFFVFVCYALITLIKRLSVDLSNVYTILDIVLNFLMMDAYILTFVYVAFLINDKVFSKITTICFYVISFCFIVSIVLFVTVKEEMFFYYALGVMALVALAVIVVFTIKQNKLAKLSKSDNLLILGSVIMIISFVLLVCFNILHIGQVYYCAFGLFFYLFFSECVTINQIITFRRQK